MHVFDTTFMIILLINQKLFILFYVLMLNQIFIILKNIDICIWIGGVFCDLPCNSKWIRYSLIEWKSIRWKRIYFVGEDRCTMTAPIRQDLDGGRIYGITLSLYVRHRWWSHENNLCHCSLMNLIQITWPFVCKIIPQTLVKSILNVRNFKM